MNNKQSVESSAPEQELSESIASSEARVEPTSPPERIERYQQPAGQDVEGFPTELLELIGKEIDRRFQSAKDKRWAQLEKQYGDLHELNSRQEPALPHQGTNRVQTEFEAQVMERAETLLKRLGLRNSPEAAALLRDQEMLQGPGGYLDLIDRVLDIVLGETGENAHPGPTLAGVIAPGGGAVANRDLTAAYRSRKRNIRPGDINALTALKREFREKGLNIF